MTDFPKRESARVAARVAARQAQSETDRLIRDARDTADRRGSLEVDEANSIIYFDGEISESYLGGIDAPMMRDALSQLKNRPITLRLNSPGGDVDTGLSIYNALRAHSGGLTIVAELAASMGSLLLQAADKRIVTPSGMVMLHAPWSIAAGDAAEFERRAAILRKYGERLIPIYSARTRKSEDEIRELFMGEHWYSAQESVDFGLADEVANRPTQGRPKMASARRASIRSRVAALNMDTNAIVAAYGG